MSIEHYTKSQLEMWRGLVRFSSGKLFFLSTVNVKHDTLLFILERFHYFAKQFLVSRNINI